MTYRRTWTFVLSEYLDLPFLLRSCGEPVVSARSADEALDLLRQCQPARIIIDQGCHGADSVAAYAADRYPGATVQFQDQVLELIFNKE